MVSTPSSRSDRALLVLDMHRALVDEVPGGAEIIPYIKGELRYFRERDRPVFFAVPEGGAEPIKELTPRRGERVFPRAAPSAFFGTELEEEVRAAEVSRLTLVGLETCTSVLVTAADALARGFQVIVPDPCVAARDPNDHRCALRLIRDVWTPGAEASTSGWHSIRLRNGDDAGDATK